MNRKELLLQRLADPDWQVGRILVVKPSALGDVVQSLPLASVLRQRFPDATVDWVIAEGLSEMLDGHPRIQRTFLFRRRGGVGDWWRLLRDLRRARHDLVLDLQGLARSGIMTAATRAPVRIGLESAREAAWLACHLRLPDTGGTLPAYRRYQRVAECLGMDGVWAGAGAGAEINIGDSHRTFAEDELQGARRWLAVHPGARWQTKRWPWAKFAAVLRRFAAEFEAGIVLVGGRQEAGDCRMLEAALGGEAPDTPIRNLAGQTTLKQLAAVLAESRLLLTNDSGPLHLADAVGTPVVGLFTCTSADRSGPAGAAHALLQADIDCAGSYCKVCPHAGRAHEACFDRLEVDHVWQACRQQWSRDRARDAA